MCVADDMANANSGGCQWKDCDDHTATSADEAQGDEEASYGKRVSQMPDKYSSYLCGESIKSQVTFPSRIVQLKPLLSASTDSQKIQPSWEDRYIPLGDSLRIKIIVFFKQDSRSGHTGFAQPILLAYLKSKSSLYRHCLHWSNIDPLPTISNTSTRAAKLISLSKPIAAQKQGKKSSKNFKLVESQYHM